MILKLHDNEKMRMNRKSFYSSHLKQFVYAFWRKKDGDTDKIIQI